MYSVTVYMGQNAATIWLIFHDLPGSTRTLLRWCYVISYHLDLLWRPHDGHIRTYCTDFYTYTCRPTSDTHRPQMLGLLSVRTS